MNHSPSVIRIGVVGCGRVAQQRHLPLAAGLTGAKLVAISDVDGSTREKLTAQYKLSHTYADYRELIASDAVDAVMIATPTQFHAEVGVAAIAGGKHVMIEKPLALSLDEVDRLEDAANRTTKTVAVAMNSRWHRLIRQARDVVRSKALGPVGLLRSAFTDGFRHNEEPRSWMMKHELAGSVLVEQAIHHFDLWQFLLDAEVLDIYAKMHDPMTVNERAVVTATMSTGVIVSGMFSEGLKDTNELEIYGRDARLRVSVYDFDGLDITPRSEYPGSMGTRLRRLKQTILAFPGAMKRNRTGGDWAGSYRSEWDHFLDCIRQGRKPECGLREGRRALQIGLAAKASLASGAAVKIAAAPRTIMAYAG